MQPTQILKNLSRAHFLYRRAHPGSVEKDTHRTHISIYQRLYHSSTGDWPPMPLINATIHRYQSEFWQNYIRQKALASPRSARPITNSGPGGPNCQAKSADSCRCKSIPMTPQLANTLQTVGFTQEEISKLQEITAVAPVQHVDLQEAKKELKTTLRQKKGLVSNPHFNVEAEINSDIIGESLFVGRINESTAALTQAGICDQQTAFRIHLAAAAEVDSLFRNAPRCISEPVKAEHLHKKEEALHFYAPFKAEGIEKPLTANISVIKFIRRQKRTLYAISLKIEPSVPAVGPLTQ